MQIRINNPKNGGIQNHELAGDGWTLGEATDQLIENGTIGSEDKVALNGMPNANEDTQLRDGDTLDVFPGKPEGSVQ